MRVSWEEAVARGWAQATDVPKRESRAPRCRKRDREAEEQSELIAVFERAYPALANFLIHIPNGGSRKNRFEGYRLKKQGVRPGVSDLQLTLARGGYFGLWIEFKAAPPFDAAVSASQQEWISSMREQGYAARVCRGVEEAFGALQDYLQLPPTAPTPSAIDRGFNR